MTDIRVASESLQVISTSDVSAPARVAAIATQTLDTADPRAIVGGVSIQFLQKVRVGVELAGWWDGTTIKPVEPF
jgi:hypothetical protein